MAEPDFFAAVRIAEPEGEATLFAIPDAGIDAAVPSVPNARERGNPQKSATFPPFPSFPLTALIVELMKHPNPGKVDPVRAAERFGLKVDVATYYIQQERRRRES